eukprot:16430178-Heterocapsa_arctica.AAC.1
MQASDAGAARDCGPTLDCDPAAPPAAEAPSEVIRLPRTSPSGVPPQPAGAPTWCALRVGAWPPV